MNKPMLMIPGPVDPPDEVLRRCGMPVFAHYGSDFAEFYTALVEKARYLFGMSDGSVQIPTGSGTTAVNMMLTSLCAPDDTVLVLNNGGFGDYAERNLRCLGIPYTSVKAEHGTAIEPESVREQMLRRRHEFIYVTHNESSTAVLTPLAPMGEIAREFDALLLVDAVSSVGGVVIDMDGSGADVVAGASQKCLELPPGLAPVAVGARAWDYMRAMPDRRVPYVLDFMMWEWSMQARGDWHPGLTTGPTTMLYALDWMIDRVREEGLKRREERFRAAGLRLKQGIEALGFTVITDPRYASPVVTEFVLPEGMLAEDLHTHYLQEHNVMVGHGGRTNADGESISIRVAHFGRAAEDARIDLLIEITREFVDRHG
jgi:aspartate aminotransferase-like enzyme